MATERISGILLLLGSALFLTAAFLPISWVFGERDLGKKVEMINASPEAWRIAQFLFGSGAIIAAMGFLPAYLDLRGKGAGAPSLVAFLLALIGAVLWARHTYLRGVDPVAFVHKILTPRWLAGAYFILTQGALLAMGIALRKANYPDWIAWLNIGSAIAFSLLLIIFQDLPPFAYYLVTAVTAIVFLRSS